MGWARTWAGVASGAASGSAVGPRAVSSVGEGLGVPVGTMAEASAVAGGCDKGASSTVIKPNMVVGWNLQK